MAGKPLTAEQIREILRLHSVDQLSNREIARRLIPKVNKETVNHYIAFVRKNGLDIGTLLQMGDDELDRVFHKGDPAYTEYKMDLFLKDIPVFKEERLQRGMTVGRMWRNHRERHKFANYKLAQFRHHLARAGLLPPPKGKPLPKREEREIRAIATIGGCTTSCYSPASGKMETVHFVALYMVSSQSMRICPATTLAINEIVGKVGELLSKIGGVPHALDTDELRKGCARPDKSIPAVRTVLREMASYYGFEPSFKGEKDSYALARTHIDRAFNHLNHTLAKGGYYTMVGILEAVSTFEQRYNRTRVRGAQYSREEDFLKDEEPWLIPLRGPQYEAVTTSIHKVYEDGTVQVGKEMGTGFYSVPAAFIGKKVRCILSSKTVTVLDSDELIAEHPRIGGYRYSIQDDHQREWEVSQYNNTHVRLNTASMLLGILGTWMGLYFNETVISGHRVQECYRRYAHIMRMAYADIPAMAEACNICVRDGVHSYHGLKEAYELHHKKK